MNQGYGAKPMAMEKNDANAYQNGIPGTRLAVSCR